MRIGIISTMRNSPWGGSEELWLRTAEAALDQGHQVAVSVGPLAAASPRLQHAKVKGLQVMTCAASCGLITNATRSLVTGVKSVLHGRKLVWRLADRMRVPDPRWKSWFRFAPDVVLINCASNLDFGKSEEFNAPAEWLRSTRRPYVAVCHSAWEGDLPWPALRNRLLEFFNGAACAGFASQFAVRLIERQLLASLPRTFTVANPVNLRERGVVSWPASPPFRIACVARLEVTNKGHDMLLEAFSDPVWRDREWELQIAGEGPHRSYIEDLARFYGIQQKVRLLGQVEDIRKLWAENHLFVLPSRHESAPLTLIEAMLCGRPTVVTACGGTIEWAAESDYGFIAEGATVRSIRAALERAWQARDLWPEMGRRAFDMASKRLDPNPAGSLLALLDQACKTRR